MLHPFGDILPCLEPSCLFVLISVSQRPITVLLFDRSYYGYMFLVECICLLHCYINHLLGLNVLSLTPDIHGMSTIRFPEHSPDLCQGPGLLSLLLIHLGISFDRFKALLLQRL